MPLQRKLLLPVQQRRRRQRKLHKKKRRLKKRLRQRGPVRLQLLRPRQRLCHRPCANARFSIRARIKRSMLKPW